MATGDLAAGGLKQPQQVPPTPGVRPKKPKGPIAKTIDFQGLPVHVDRPYGHVQNGMDAAGKEWKRIYHVDYGFIPSTQGGDADDLDVYMGLDKEAPDAHWILQKKANGD